MDAHCPKCRFVELKEIDSGRGFQVDDCPECGGRWFDLGELEKASASPEKFKEASANAPLRPRDTDRECPRCDRKLVNGGLINELLRADFCGACRGIWLDKAEIGLVDRLLAGG